MAQAEQRYSEVCEKLEAAAVEREELRRSERQALHRAQELSDSLLESQAKIKVHYIRSGSSPSCYTVTAVALTARGHSCVHDRGAECGQVALIGV